MCAALRKAQDVGACAPLADPPLRGCQPLKMISLAGMYSWAGMAGVAGAGPPAQQGRRSQSPPRAPRVHAKAQRCGGPPLSRLL
eukprot:9447098-Lingulodinium_polyedra.AAC.1